MSNISHEQTAFPETYTDAVGTVCSTSGLTKREYFAAKAMQGILAGRPHPNSIETVDACRWAIECADTLLAMMDAELDKPQY